MNENSYEEYKKNFSRERKKRNALHNGKWQLVLGVLFLLYTLWIVPFHAVDVHEISGSDMKAGKPYYPEKVYYIENLQILRAKTDAKDDNIYCIARFLDRDENDWIISFTPGRDQDLAERIRLSSSFETELNITISGYFKLEYLEDLPSAADSFHSVYGPSYADADGQNMLSMNAEYLCKKYDNYIYEILLHPGIPFGSLVVGLVSVIMGGYLLIRHRTPKSS